MRYTDRMESTLQYVTDDKGAKTAVLLPLQIIAVGVAVPYDQFVAELRRDGVLSD